MYLNLKRLLPVDGIAIVFLASMSLLVGCGGGGGGDSGSTVTCTTPSGPTVTISGLATFDKVPHDLLTNGLDYPNTASAAVRGATVEAIEAGTSVCVMGSGKTDATGTYSLEVPENTEVFIRVKALMQQTGTPAWDFRVVDNTNNQALYAMNGAVFDTGTSPAIRNLHAPSGWGGSSYTGPRVAAPFAILDAVYVAFNKVLAEDPDMIFPALRLNWSIRNVPASGNPADGNITTTLYNGTEIFILGAENRDTDEYDDHVIVHEWSHYFENTFSRVDSPGGPHAIGEQLDLRLAFSEGWGNAFAGMATDDPVYRDAFGPMQANGFDIDVDDNNTLNPGWYSEGSVQAVLYDLYDSMDDSADLISLGFTPIYEVLIGSQRNTPAQTSIFSFITALKMDPSLSEQDINDINTLVSSQAMNSNMDIYGSLETNAAGNADVLPVYTQVTPGGSQVSVCSTDAFGEFNKLSNSRFLRFSIGAQASYTISANTLSSSISNPDPDMILYRQDTVLATGRDIGAAESFTRTLSSGDYVLEIYEASYIDGIESAPPNGPVCFGITVQ